MIRRGMFGTRGRLTANPVAALTLVVGAALLQPHVAGAAPSPPAQGQLGAPAGILPAGSGNGSIPPVGYVAVRGPCCTSGSVVAFDPATGAVRATISVGGSPSAIAITPDGGRVLVPNNDGYLSVIDARSGQQTKIASCVAPGAVAVTPNGRTAVLTCPPAATVQLIDLVAGAVVSTIVVGQSSSLPYSVAVSTDGLTAYVVNYNGSSPEDPAGTVVPIVLKTGETRPPIRLSGREAIGAAVTPDGRRLLVGVRGTTTSGSALDVIDTRTSAIISVESLPGGPSTVAVSADGATAYVSSPFANAIAALSLEGKPTPPQRSGILTMSLAVTPDQSTLLSTSPGSGGVELLGIPSLLTSTYVVTAQSPMGLAVSPDQSPQASLRILRRQGRAITFDASASRSPSTPIARYDWDFGDGTRSVTTTPTTSHAYRHPGRYQASVTLTDRAGTSTKQVFTGQTMSRNGSSAARAGLGLIIL
jgi:YVTN family beta-propeller protein